MQAANHFYKVLDEHTIIIVPDNPQARRDYEDLVIRTFYLSNGDAEQVTNVVRTMIEARNVFPLKALNAITIRDTADKVRIAEKIIEANDKAKAEVVVDVELLQLDLDKTRDLGFVINGYGSTSPGILQPLAPATSTAGGNVALTQGTLADLRRLNSGLISFSIPNASYTALKSIGNSELLANPELRISEGEKATLHIGNRIPVPVSTFTSVATGGTSGTFAPVTSYQYQDVGIKVSIEPRVHHNREVTLKLTVEVSNQGPMRRSPEAGQAAAADVRHAHDRVDDPPQRRRDELPGRPHSAERRRQRQQDAVPRRHPHDRPSLHEQSQADAAHRSDADDDAAHHPHPRHHRG